jgi:FMN phosphatase YigB (HAD superfamily)
VAGSLELLDGLSNQGVKLALVSQIDWDLLKVLLPALGIEERFDIVLSASDVGVPRPDPAVVREALKRLGVPAVRSVMIGDDSVADVEPARALGMHSIHVLGEQEACDCGADHHVDTLTEVVKLFAAD